LLYIKKVYNTASTLHDQMQNVTKQLSQISKTGKNYTSGT